MASSLTRPRLVGHRPIVVEPALARPEVLTLAHVNPKSPPQNLTHGSSTRPLASADCQRNSAAILRLNDLGRFDAQSQSLSTLSKAGTFSQRREVGMSSNAHPRCGRRTFRLRDKHKI